MYCKDANRRGDSRHTSFDFLGYTFRGRLAKGRRGYFTGFSPAISAKAKKAKGKVRHERGEEFHVGGILRCGAARKMKVLWPFGAALRGEASNHRMLR